MKIEVITQQLVEVNQEKQEYMYKFWVAPEIDCTKTDKLKDMHKWVKFTEMNSPEYYFDNALLYYTKYISSLNPLIPFSDFYTGEPQYPLNSFMESMALYCFNGDTMPITIPSFNEKDALINDKIIRDVVLSWAKERLPKVVEAYEKDFRALTI